MFSTLRNSNLPWRIFHGGIIDGIDLATSCQGASLPDFGTRGCPAVIRMTLTGSWGSPEDTDDEFSVDSWRTMVYNVNFRLPATLLTVSAVDFEIRTLLRLLTRGRRLSTRKSRRGSCLGYSRKFWDQIWPCKTLLSTRNFTFSRDRNKADLLVYLKLLEAKMFAKRW